MRCAQWSFSPGDRLTVVVLHGPSALRTVSESGGGWRGHSDIFLHYVAEPESPASGGGIGGVAIGSAATGGSRNGRARLGSHYTFQRLNDAAASKADATAELLAMQQPTCQRGSRSEVFFAGEERRRGLRQSSFMRGFASSLWQLLQR